MMRVSLVFAWYYFWIGLFWDRHKRRLYILPLPCFGICLHFASASRQAETCPESRRLDLGHCCHARFILNTCCWCGAKSDAFGVMQTAAETDDGGAE